MPMRRYRYYRALLFALMSLIPVCAGAQKIGASVVLARLRASVQQMTSALPSLICHEEVFSAETVHGKVKVKGHFGYQLTVTRPARHGVNFPEERKLLTYDGKPIRRDKRYAPIFMYLDGFGATFDDILSPAAGHCLLYSAHETTVDGVKALELDVRANLTALTLRTCREYKDDPYATASFWISAASGQLLRFHIHMPRAKLTYWRRVVGIPHSIGIVVETHSLSTAVIDTDYRSVQFGPALTLIPAKVNMTAILLKKPYIEYTYNSVQSECHRFLATVTLIPGKMVSPEN